MRDEYDELLSLANREHQEREQLIAEITGWMYPGNPSRAEASEACRLRNKLTAYVQANPPGGMGN